MKLKNGALFAMAVVCIVTAIQSGVVFQDPFDNKNNWAKATGNCTDVIQNSQYVITATTLSIFKHTQPFQTFTYSMDLKIESNYSRPNGILFCAGANLNGYIFTLSNQQYNIGWIMGTSVDYDTLKSGFNSFVSTTPGSTNILKVSKTGNTISFFCNNTILEKITNAAFSQGDIGFLVSENQKVAFNHALVVDTAEVGKYKSWFVDHFEDNNLAGWGKLPVANYGGNVKSENGVMKVVADSQTIFYTSGQYKDMPCTTIVEYKGGKKDALYGIIFIVVQTGSISAYYYLINSERYYLVSQTGGGSPKIDSRIHGTKDTLVVTADYDFYVNGNMLDNSMPAGSNFNAAGIIVYQGATVHYDDFRAGVNDGTPIHNPIQLGPYTKNKTNYMLGGVGLIYDIRGRKVASFDDGYKAKLKELGAGHYYIVVPNGNQKHVIRQAIINAQ